MSLQVLQQNMKISQAKIRTTKKANEAVRLIKSQLDPSIQIYWFGSWPKERPDPVQTVTWHCQPVAHTPGQTGFPS